jgi:hypothetical protein
MTRTVAALDDYLNAWVVQYMYLGEYMDHAKEGDHEGMQTALRFVREHVDKPDEYQANLDIKFEPGFSPSQKHRLNYLAEMYNHLAPAGEPDIDELYRIAQMPMKIVRKWANRHSSR